MKFCAVMRSPVLAVHIGESVQPLKLNLDGDTSLFWSLAEWYLVGWWWIINNAVWRKGSILPPLDSQDSCTSLSEQSSWSWWILSWRKDENSLCVERAEEATALILNSSLLCVDYGFSGSQSSVPCPQSLVWICFLMLCTVLSASVWPELCWLKLGATDSHLKWVQLKSLFNTSSTQVTIVTLALLTHEVCGVWDRKSGWFRHVFQDILPGHNLYMPTTAKRFVVMFKGGGEDRFTLESSKCCWRQTQTQGTEDVCLCVDGLAAGVVDTLCYVDITAAQFSLLRRMWGLFPLALSGIVFFSSPPPPVPVKWDFEIFLWKGLTGGDRLSCCQQRLMS